MNTPNQTALQPESVAIEATEVILRTIENAELIQVGGGYCAADY